MVVASSPLPSPLPGGGAIENSGAASSGDSAVHIPPTAGSFRARLGSALQSRRADSVPASKSVAPPAGAVGKPESNPDSASNPDASANDAAPAHDAADSRKSETAAAPADATVANPALIASVSQSVPAPLVPTADASKAAIAAETAAPATGAISAAQSTAPSQEKAVSISPVQSVSLPPAAALPDGAAGTKRNPAPSQTQSLSAAAPALPLSTAPYATVASASGQISPQQNDAPVFAAASPTSSAASVDSRLVRSATTPGTDQAQLPLTVFRATPSAATGNASAPNSQPTSNTEARPAFIGPDAPASNGAVLSEVGSAAPDAKGAAVALLPISSTTVSKPNTPADAKAPVTIVEAPRFNADATQDFLARERTTGSAANSVPASAADSAASTAPPASAVASLPVATRAAAKAAAPAPVAIPPAAARNSAENPAAPVPTVRAATPIEKPVETGSVNPPQSAVAVTPAAPKINPANALRSENPQASASPFAASDASPTAAPIVALSADAAPALFGNIENTGNTGPEKLESDTVPTVLALASHSARLVTHRANESGTKDNGGETRRDPSAAAQTRNETGVSAAKENAARPELLVHNGNAATPVASGAASASNAPNAPIDRSKLLEQVTRHLETLRFADECGEVAFHLNPDHLGSLRISIAAHADGVIARVVAEHAGVRQALESGAGHLRAALEERGLKLNALDVTTGQGTAGDGRGAGNASQQQQRETQQNRAVFGPPDARSSRIASVSETTAPTLPVAAVTRNRSPLRLDYRA